SGELRVITSMRCPVHVFPFRIVRETSARFRVQRCLRGGKYSTAMFRSDLASGTPPTRGGENDRSRLDNFMGDEYTPRIPEASCVEIPEDCGNTVADV